MMIMTDRNYPPTEIYLSPHCNDCISPSIDNEILWSEHPVGDICDICDRREIRYVLDKRFLRGDEK